MAGPGPSAAGERRIPLRLRLRHPVRRAAFDRYTAPGHAPGSLACQSDRPGGEHHYRPGTSLLCAVDCFDSAGSGLCGRRTVAGIEGGIPSSRTEAPHRRCRRTGHAGGSAASDGPRWAGGMAAGGTHPDPVGLPDREPAQNWQKSGSGGLYHAARSYGRLQQAGPGGVAGPSSPDHRRPAAAVLPPARQSPDIDTCGRQQFPHPCPAVGARVPGGHLEQAGRQRTGSV